MSHRYIQERLENLEALIPQIFSENATRNRSTTNYKEDKLTEFLNDYEISKDEEEKKNILKDIKEYIELNKKNKNLNKEIISLSDNQKTILGLIKVSNKLKKHSPKHSKGGYKRHKRTRRHRKRGPKRKSQKRFYR